MGRRARIRTNSIIGSSYGGGTGGGNTPTNYIAECIQQYGNSGFMANECVRIGHNNLLPYPLNTTMWHTVEDCRNHLAGGGNSPHWDECIRQAADLGSFV